MQRRKAFTLVELLVVIAIIAVLIAILLPVLGRAKEQANRVICMNNHRSLIMAVRMYADDWKNYIPYVNSNAHETNGDWTGPGWLYWALKGKTQEQDVENGVLWKFIRNRKIYRCPFDPPPYLWGGPQNLSSYSMNRAMLGLIYNSVQPGNDIMVYKPSYKINRFKPDDILFWESDEYLSIWNDGCNTPDEGITARHGSVKQKSNEVMHVWSKAAGAIVGCIGGNAEWITVYDFYQDAARAGGRVRCGPYYRD